MTEMTERAGDMIGMIPISDFCMAWYGDTNKMKSASTSMASVHRGNGVEFEVQREPISIT